MAQRRTFKVSKRGQEGVEVTFNAPENLSDPRWDELVGNKEEDVSNLALQSLIINIQSGARQRLAGGLEKVQEFVDSYKLGQRIGGLGRVVMAADEVAKLKFTPEQIAAMKAAGMQIPGLEE